MSAAKSKTTFERLCERVPDEYIKQRKQGGANLSYVSWYDACNLLDERAPGWSMEIKEVGEIGGKVYVRVALTVEGVTRENIGCEDEDLKGYGDVFSNSVGMALRRAGALFGLGRHLYDKDDKRPHQRPQSPPLRSPAAPDERCEKTARQPQGKGPLQGQIDWLEQKYGPALEDECRAKFGRNLASLSLVEAGDWIKEIGQAKKSNEFAPPIAGMPSSAEAKTMADLVTPKQLVAIRAIANAGGINAETFCMEKLKCRPEELSRKAASIFIDHLKEQATDGGQAQRQ